MYFRPGSPKRTARRSEATSAPPQQGIARERVGVAVLLADRISGISLATPIGITLPVTTPVSGVQRRLAVWRPAPEAM